MLKAAGVEFDVVPADIDEAAVRDVFTANNSAADPTDIALVLASTKAETVANAHPGALVIGGDQILAMDGALFDKPTDMSGAAKRLLTLRGCTHQLHAGVVLALNGDVVWSASDVAHLTMREFSAGFVGRHLAQVGETALESVGAYQLEARGVQLFDKIDGDFFTILGMPLLPLLQELRRRGCVE